MLKRLCLVLALGSVLGSGRFSPRADADTVVQLHFVTDVRGESVVGYGSFSFADGLTTVGVDDLTWFEFQATVFDAIQGGQQVFTYDPTALKTSPPRSRPARRDRC